MIANICNYKPRTEAIHTVIINSLKKHPTSQIMILANNLCLLSDMESIILNKSPTLSYGFYVGGMKKQALTETEKKQVVLATYAMANEGLDISTLSQLILSSPKKDIIQSVGRILRDKGSNPKIVVDIIDPNKTFTNQWKKRLTYYKKCNYNVYKCNKWDDYVENPDIPENTEDSKTSWKQLFPKVKKCEKPNSKFVKGNIDDDDSDDSDDSDKDDKDDKDDKCMIVFSPTKI
jgi:hypothetical protein